MKQKAKKSFASISRNTYYIIISFIVLSAFAYASSGVVTGSWTQGTPHFDSVEYGDLLQLGHIQDVVENINAVYTLFHLPFVDENGAIPPASSGSKVDLFEGYAFRADKIKTDDFVLAGNSLSINDDDREILDSYDKDGTLKLEMEGLEPGTDYLVMVNYKVPYYGNGNVNFRFVWLYSCSNSILTFGQYPQKHRADGADGNIMTVQALVVTAPMDGCIFAQSAGGDATSIFYMMAIPI